MDVRFQFSIAIARTEHSSFSEREHAALEGLLIERGQTNDQIATHIPSAQ